MEIKIGFIKQTAHDYNMTYDEVLKIYNTVSLDEFYNELELFIKNRARRNL